MEKCLYVSDLDGTLLRSDETISDYTCSVINKLTQSGMLFSYATARSYVTAKKVTKGLGAKIPLIVYNGAFVIDNLSEEVLISNFFPNDIKNLLEELFSNEIYPIVYSYIDEVEHFSFIPGKCSKGMRDFLHAREGDKRWREAENCEQLMQGNMFYITCIDEKEKLEPFYEKYKDKYHVVSQKDIYTREQWLEIMPKEASKANAILQLKKLLGCEKVISFGDAANDVDMFHISDEAYAVANANEELKQIATGVIESNNEDGVAKWLERKNYMEEHSMLRLRPFRKNDAKKIITWTSEPEEFYKWSAGILGEFPLTEQRLLEATSGRDADERYFPFTAFDENGPAGFFIVRIPGDDDKKVRFGFVIVDPAKRGMGYGKQMLHLGLTFAFDVFGAESVSLGVFENNMPAYHCYKSIGFKENGERVAYEINGETWIDIEMENRKLR